MTLRRWAGLVALGLAAGSVLHLAPGQLDREHWSLFDPVWLRVSAVLLPLYGLLMAYAAGRVAADGAGWRVLAALAPGLALKPIVTDLRHLAGHAEHLAIALPPLLVSAALVWRCGPRGPQLGALLAAFAVLLPAGLRYGELSAQEAIFVTGEVETIVRELARRVGDDTFTHGDPPADLADWLARFQPPGWIADDGRLAWQPAPGVSPTVLSLSYQAPRSARDIVLEGGADTFVRRDARRLRVEIRRDGSVEWTWPDGPPAAVARRATP